MANATDRFAPCALIPVYNHGATVVATVHALRAHGLPVLLVDDGSDEPTRATLDALARETDGVELLRLPRNHGKGGAVAAGLRASSRRGYSHALQVDADGQHDTGDVPRFLAAGRSHPEALICGVPMYDASVPRGRLYGRYVTHVCVWLETLSLAIRDSMCGYRLYPLEATCALLDHHPLPTRMDFDTEIAVRLYWRGLGIINLPTHVIYPEHGVSHFRLFRDNLRISAMHTRLLLGMLPRLPGLLRRRGEGVTPCAP